MTVTLRNVDDDFLAELEKLIFPRKDIVLELCYDTPNVETLHGNWKGHGDCQIRSDWILIYKIAYRVSDRRLRQ